jgi:alkylated DNA repair protein (DNA oxidative demethylase)
MTVLGEGCVLLHGFALAAAPSLLAAVRAVAAAAPFRRMATPRGPMSVAMTSCGCVGWTSDEAGYRYSAMDPLTARPWPDMPAVLRDLAAQAAGGAGFPVFEPDTCLLNEYEPGARLSLHQDKNERDPAHPIVSISLGLPAAFAFGGVSRKAPVRRWMLESGDVVVFGGPARLAYHGVEPLPDGEHPLTGRRRINLTFRRAL